MPRIIAHILFVVLLWTGLSAGVHADEMPTFDVTAKDGRLFPERLEVPAGQRVKLVVRNEGKTPIEFENARMRVEKVVAPGGRSFVVLPKLKPGEYEFVDEFHEDTGRMKIVAQ